MRILHTMLRVSDLEKSVKFYTWVFGMQEIKRTDYPNGKFTLVFIGYGSEEENTLIELTYNWDVNNYELGTAFGHIAIEVNDIYKVCDKAREFGVAVTREPGPMKFGGTRAIAFVEDPNGYKIELIENKI
ncbi:MAG: gloA [Burkholderiales bacterium]|nr:gloA [Burkholderiales bacterium]